MSLAAVVPGSASPSGWRILGRHVLQLRVWKIHGDSICVSVHPVPRWQVRDDVGSRLGDGLYSLRRRHHLARERRQVRSVHGRKIRYVGGVANMHAVSCWHEGGPATRGRPAFLAMPHTICPVALNSHAQFACKLIDLAAGATKVGMGGRARGGVIFRVYSRVI